MTEARENESAKRDGVSNPFPNVWRVANRQGKPNVPDGANALSGVGSAPKRGQARALYRPGTPLLSARVRAAEGNRGLFPLSGHCRQLAQAEQLVKGGQGAYRWLAAARTTEDGDCPLHCGGTCEAPR